MGRFRRFWVLPGLCTTSLLGIQSTAVASGFDLIEAPTVVYQSNTKSPFPIFKSATAACNFAMTATYTGPGGWTYITLPGSGPTFGPTGAGTCYFNSIQTSVSKTYTQTNLPDSNRIQKGYACRLGFSISNNVCKKHVEPPVKLNQCDKKPPSMGTGGNPVSLGSGGKLQSEEDGFVISRSRRIALSRNYSSDSSHRCDIQLGTGWTLDQFGTFLRMDGSAATPATFTVLAHRADGQEVSLTWNGQTTAPIWADSTTGLTLSQNANSTWTLTDAQSGTVEIYNSGGLPTQIWQRDGLALTLNYSDRSNLDICPQTNQILSGVTSPNQDVLWSFQQDAVSLGRLGGATLSDGSAVVQYEYDGPYRWLSAVVRPGGERKLFVRESANNPYFLNALPDALTYSEGIDSSTFTAAASPPSVSASTGTTIPAWVTPQNLFERDKSNYTGIVDENGDRFATYVYDDQGRVTHEDHAGTYNHSFVYSPGKTEMTTPDGVVVTTSFAEVNGFTRPVSRSQPAGTGCSASTKSLDYDADGNVISETDFNGNRTCRVFDQSSQRRAIETMRQEGFKVSETCPASYNFAPLAVGQRRIWTEWHPDWILPIRRAEPQLVTTWVYNGQPDPTDTANPYTRVWCVQHSDGVTAANAVLLPNRKPLAVLCRKVEQPTSDLQGLQQPSTAKASGNPRRWSYTYNEFGQVLTETDPIDSVTRYEYHPTTTADVTAGDLMRVTDPVGRTTTYPSYNRRGQPLSIVTSSGLTTSLHYTPRGWIDLVSVTPTAGGATRTTSYTYDKVGQVTGITQPDGASVQFTKYDAAHRLITKLDASGNTWTHGYDDAGRLKTLTITDPTGATVRTQSRVYDPLGRVQSETGFR